MAQTPNVTAGEAAEKRSFTGDKLDWMTALCADPRIDARAFRVGFTIAQHINMRKGVAFISDETISDKTSIPTRWVQRARALLRTTRWIDWKRTQSANLYWILPGNIDPVTDHQIMLRDARADRRASPKSNRRVSPRVAHLMGWDTPQVASSDPPQVANPDPPGVADKHLSSTPE